MFSGAAQLPQAQYSCVQHKLGDVVCAPLALIFRHIHTSTSRQTLSPHSCHLVKLAPEPDCMHAGVVQPIKEIGKLCRSKKVFFHTDAAQAVGKIPMNVNDANIDLMSISGHKIYGPKGVGAIYIRRRPRVRLEAQINGGGQVVLLRRHDAYESMCQPDGVDRKFLHSRQRMLRCLLKSFLSGAAAHSSTQARALMIKWH